MLLQNIQFSPIQLEVRPGLERFFNVFGPCPDASRDSPLKEEAAAAAAAAAAAGYVDDNIEFDLAIRSGGLNSKNFESGYTRRGRNGKAGAGGSFVRGIGGDGGGGSYWLSGEKEGDGGEGDDSDAVSGAHRVSGLY